VAGRLIQVKITNQDRYRTAKGFPPNKATNTAGGRAKNRVLQTGHPIERGRLIEGRHIQVRLYIIPPTNKIQQEPLCYGARIIKYSRVSLL